jgi:hypothetical protein
VQLGGQPDPLAVGDGVLVRPLLVPPDAAAAGARVPEPVHEVGDGARHVEVLPVPGHVIGGDPVQRPPSGVVDRAAGEVAVDLVGGALTGRERAPVGLEAVFQLVEVAPVTGAFHVVADGLQRDGGVPPARREPRLLVVVGVQQHLRGDAGARHVGRAVAGGTSGWALTGRDYAGVLGRQTLRGRARLGHDNRLEADDHGEGYEDKSDPTQHQVGSSPGRDVASRIHPKNYITNRGNAPISLFRGGGWWRTA